MGEINHFDVWLRIDCFLGTCVIGAAKQVAISDPPAPRGADVASRGKKFPSGVAGRSDPPRHMSEDVLRAMLPCPQLKDATGTLRTFYFECA